MVRSRASAGACIKLEMGRARNTSATVCASCSMVWWPVISAVIRAATCFAHSTWWWLKYSVCCISALVSRLHKKSSSCCRQSCTRSGPPGRGWSQWCSGQDFAPDCTSQGAYRCSTALPPGIQAPPSPGPSPSRWKRRKPATLRRRRSPAVMAHKMRLS